MPSTPITPHLFPRLIITSSFPAHLPLPPTLSGTVGKVMRAVISTGQLLRLLFPPHTFSLFQHGSSPGSAVLREISHAPEWSPWAVGTQPAAPWSLCSVPEAPPPLLSPECHRPGSHTFSFPPHCCATFCPFSSVFSQRCCRRAQGIQMCPVDGGLELCGTGCVHPRAALASPHRVRACTRSRSVPGQ